jgi:hypothetical protein
MIRRSTRNSDGFAQALQEWLQGLHIQVQGRDEEGHTLKHCFLHTLKFNYLKNKFDNVRC